MKGDRDLVGIERSLGLRSARGISRQSNKDSPPVKKVLEGIAAISKDYVYHNTSDIKTSEEVRERAYDLFWEQAPAIWPGPEEERPKWLEQPSAYNHDGKYPRHLYFTNPDDRLILRQRFYDLVVAKACNYHSNQLQKNRRISQKNDLSDAADDSEPRIQAFGNDDYQQGPVGDEGYMPSAAGPTWLSVNRPEVYGAPVSNQHSVASSPVSEQVAAQPDPERATASAAAPPHYNNNLSEQSSDSRGTSGGPMVSVDAPSLKTPVTLPINPGFESEIRSQLKVEEGDETGDDTSDDDLPIGRKRKRAESADLQSTTKRSRSVRISSAPPRPLLIRLKVNGRDLARISEMKPKPVPSLNTRSRGATEPEPTVQIRQYRYRGKWYEIEGDSDVWPSWAQEMRIVTKAAPKEKGRRRSTWLERRSSYGTSVAEVSDAGPFGTIPPWSPLASANVTDDEGDDSDEGMAEDEASAGPNSPNLSSAHQSDVEMDADEIEDDGVHSPDASNKRPVLENQRTAGRVDLPPKSPLSKETVSAKANEREQSHESSLLPDRPSQAQPIMDDSEKLPNQTPDGIGDPAISRKHSLPVTVPGVTPSETELPAEPYERMASPAEPHSKAAASQQQHAILPAHGQAEPVQQHTTPPSHNEAARLQQQDVQSGAHVSNNKPQEPSVTTTTTTQKLPIIAKAPVIQKPHVPANAPQPSVIRSPPATNRSVVQSPRAFQPTGYKQEATPRPSSSKGARNTGSGKSGDNRMFLAQEMLGELFACATVQSMLAESDQPPWWALDQRELHRLRGILTQHPQAQTDLEFLKTILWRSISVNVGPSGAFRQPGHALPPSAHVSPYGPVGGATQAFAGEKFNGPAIVHSVTSSQAPGVTPPKPNGMRPLGSAETVEQYGGFRAWPIPPGAAPVNDASQPMPRGEREAQPGTQSAPALQPVWNPNAEQILGSFVDCPSGRWIQTKNYSDEQLETLRQILIDSPAARTDLNVLLEIMEQQWSSARTQHSPPGNSGVADMSRHAHPSRPAQSEARSPKAVMPPPNAVAPPSTVPRQIPWQQVAHEVLGELSMCPTAQQILSNALPLDREQLETLRDLLKNNPEARTNMHALNSQPRPERRHSGHASMTSKKRKTSPPQRNIAPSSEQHGRFRPGEPVVEHMPGNRFYPPGYVPQGSRRTSQVGPPGEMHPSSHIYANPPTPISNSERGESLERRDFGEHHHASRNNSFVSGHAAPGDRQMMEQVPPGHMNGAPPYHRPMMQINRSAGIPATPENIRMVGQQQQQLRPRLEGPESNSPVPEAGIGSLGDVYIELNWGTNAVDFSDDMELQDFRDCNTAEAFFGRIETRVPPELQGQNRLIREVRVRAKAALKDGSRLPRIVRDDGSVKTGLKKVVRTLKAQPAGVELELEFLVVW